MKIVKERNNDEIKHDNIYYTSMSKITHIVEHGLWTINLETSGISTTQAIIVVIDFYGLYNLFYLI